MILIYSHKITPRLDYIFKTIFTDILKTEVALTTNLAEFEKTKGIKMNYSTSKVTNELFFQASTLLFETELKPQNITVFNCEDVPCFYEVPQPSAFPFDPFAASFYLISRYEEYLPHKKDAHGRFLATESLAYQHHFLTEPLVNIWIQKIAHSIESHYPHFKFPTRSGQYISTLDIDNAYAYQHKGWLRTTGALVKALIKGDNWSGRVKTIFGNQQDPYDTFEAIEKLHKTYDIAPIYFFLVGDYAKYDKNISVKNKTFQQLIQSIAAKNEIGIHPSYASNSDVKRVGVEKNRLEKISQKKIVKSRQHFLKLQLPATYHQLIDNAISEDYTMGYAEQPGFRASICSPYYFYNLKTEKATSLKIFPFVVMEATFQYYQKCSPEVALQQILTLMEKVKSVDGTFISIWHNESLSDEGIWKNWRLVYEKMLKAFEN